MNPTAKPTPRTACQLAAPPAEPRGVLIVGYGNPLCGDDGWGPAVAQRLTPYTDGQSVRVIIARQLTVELAPEIAAARLVIFIDVAVALDHGELDFARLIARRPPVALLTHHLAAASLLHLCRELYGRTPRAIVCSAGGQSFDIGAAMTNAVRVAGERAEQRLAPMLARLAKRMAPRQGAGHA